MILCTYVPMRKDATKERNYSDVRVFRIFETRKSERTPTLPVEWLTGTLQF